MAEKDEEGEVDNSCIFVNDTVSQETGENHDENPNQAFVEQSTRGFKIKSNKMVNKDEEKTKVKEKTCNFFLQGRCHWGMSGKKPRKKHS